MSYRLPPLNGLRSFEAAARHGAWNFNGRAMTNAQIGAEVAKAG